MNNEINEKIELLSYEAPAVWEFQDRFDVCFSAGSSNKTESEGEYTEGGDDQYGDN